VTPPRPLSILLAGDYPEDPQLGSSKVFFKLRDEFTALGHTCDIVWSHEIGRWPANRHLRQLAGPWMAGRALARRMGSTRYDVVDAASAEGLFLGVMNLVARVDDHALICRSNGLEHLNYARMIDDHLHGVMHKPWWRRMTYPATRLTQVAAAARLADRLIVLNEADRTFALDRGWQPADRVALVPHGISQAFLDHAPASRAPRGAGLLFCGSWDQVKGIAYLTAAMERLHGDGHRWPLTVLGPGVPAARVVASFPLAVRPLVTVIDRAPESRVVEEYRRHDVLLSTSTYEGFGLVLIEAMSQRLPVIATPAGYAATIVRDGVTGVRVPFRDAEALASAVVRLMGDPELRHRVGDAGHDAVAGLTWRATAQRTLDVYEAARSERRQ
jgi:glycosyltransferase involved in cell wall biosynthesis